MTQDISPIPVDISRDRIERLKEMGCADYIHMVMLDKIDALSARLAEVDAERDRQYDENVDRIAQQAAAEARAEAAEAECDELAAKLALAVEAIPTGFGASYWRDDGVWAIYSMPGSKDTGIRAKDEKQRDDLLAHLGSTFRAVLAQLTADTPKEGKDDDV